jgi:hypothetical protein
MSDLVLVAKATLTCGHPPVPPSPPDGLTGVLVVLPSQSVLKIDGSPVLLVTDVGAGAFKEGCPLKPTFCKTLTPPVTGTSVLKVMGMPVATDASQALTNTGGVLTTADAAQTTLKAL